MLLSLLPRVLSIIRKMNMEVFVVTGKSRAARLPTMLAAAVATALLLGAGVGQQVSESEPQPRVLIQADGPADDCCSEGHTVPGP